MDFLVTVKDRPWFAVEARSDDCLLWDLGESVAGATAALRVAHESATFDEIEDA